MGSSPRGRSQLGRTWSEIWPAAILITVFGVAAVVQVGACARVTVIGTELTDLKEQEADYEADIQALRSELAGLRDVSDLHEYMISSGLTKESAVMDVTVADRPAELLVAVPRIDPDMVAADASGGESGAVIASLAQ